MAPASVLTRAVCHMVQVVYSTLAVPIQLNRRPSNLALALPSSGSIAAVRPVIAKAVPSRVTVL
jgi:hypothetical protein